MIYVVTYATHSFGNYEKMIENEYGVQFVVLGWGEKWKGYMHKLKSIHEYCKTLKEDDIVIQLDAFDVWVKGYLQNCIEYFKKNNYKVLFSKDCPYSNPIHKYLSDRVFKTTCPKNTIINAGMYMGYVKHLLPIMEEAVKSDELDDQRIFNKLCGNFQNEISIDHDNVIFQNVDSNKLIENSNAIFVQYPGKPSIARWSRAVTDYSRYLVFEIIVLLLILCLIYYGIMKLRMKRSVK